MAEGTTTVMSPCRLTAAQGDPICDFRSVPGAVTLHIENTKGSVQFENVRLNGSSVPGTPCSQITITLTKGQNKLDIVYVFSDPVNGKAELHELCKDDTLIDTLSANSPAVRYVICA
jgi:hypothetical protein